MNGQTTLFPCGLTRKQAQILESLARGVDTGHPEIYLQETRKHLEEAEAEAPLKPHINLRLAKALAGIFEKIHSRWHLVPGFAKSYLCGAMRYFASYQDEINDFDSFIGFEDDAEVLNACLVLAGFTDLIISPEEFDSGECDAL